MSRSRVSLSATCRSSAATLLLAVAWSPAPVSAFEALPESTAIEALAPDSMTVERTLLAPAARPDRGEASGSWRPLTASNPPLLTPQGRLAHSLVLDPVRRRLVLYGGFFGSTYLGDCWTLPLDGSNRWQVLETGLGPGPGPRRAHAAIYDPVRDRMVVFGGTRAPNDSTRLNDVWALSLGGTPVWSPITPSGVQPSGRYVHAAIYDPVRDRMIVFGGYDGDEENDVWALSLGPSPAWTRLLPSGTPPSRRDDLAAIYDPDGDRMVLFGGFDGSQILNDTWSLTLGAAPAWTRVEPSGEVPPARRTPIFVYDPSRREAVLFGGWNGGPGFHDAWTLSLVGPPRWTEIPASSPSPTARWGHAAVVDPQADRLVVFGGVDVAVWRNDTWALSLGGDQAWERLLPAPSAPGPRRAHRALYDHGRHRMIVFGGTASPNDSTRLDEIWVLDLLELDWSSLAPTGPRPSGRYVFAAIHDTKRDRLVIFGGYAGAERNDVWALPLAPGSTWEELAPQGPLPSPRADLEAVYDSDSDRMLILMGYDGSQLLDEVWALSFSDPPHWEKLEPARQGPAPRRTPSAVFDAMRRRVVLFGGWDGGPGFGDTWELVLHPRPRWRQVAERGDHPGARWGQTLVLDSVRDRLVLFGGVDLADWRNDTWVLPLRGSGRWRQLEPMGPVPQKRLTHSAIYDSAKDRMLVFGGYVGATYLGDLWALDWSSGPRHTVAPDAGDGVEESGDSLLPTRLSVRPLAFANSKGVVLAVSTPEAAEITLEIFDVRGRRIWAETVRGEPGETRVRVPGSAFPGAGVHFLRAAQAEQRVRAKVVALP